MKPGSTRSLNTAPSYLCCTQASVDTGWIGSLKSWVVRKYVIFFCFFSDLFFLDLYLLALRLTSAVYMMSSWCCVDSLTTCQWEKRNDERGQSRKETPPPKKNKKSERFMLMSADFCKEDVRLFYSSRVLQRRKAVKCGSGVAVHPECKLEDLRDHLH